MANLNKAALSPEELIKLLDYEPITGELRWKPRPSSLFSSERIRKVWNTRYSGKLAFGVSRHDGYLKGSIFNKKYQAHRVAWAIHYGCWPVDCIDHINGIRTDNRIENLRDVSRTQNQRNMRRSIKNRSGIVGVRWSSHANMWRARIGIDGKTRHLGYFHSIEEAQAARKAAEREHGFHPNHGNTTLMEAEIVSVI